MKKSLVKLLKTIEIPPTIIKITEIVMEKPIFYFPEVTTEYINKIIIKSLNPNKATSPDRIPLKIIQTAANVIDSYK